MSTNVAVLVGSLRKESFSRKTAHALMQRAPESLSCRIVEIRDLSLYNQDLDPTPPETWVRFRDEIRQTGAVLFVTPEYNRSIPGVLKNAIDIGSRPYGQSVFDKLPAGVVSVTPSKLGAFGANHVLRQSLVFLNMPTMQQPEAYIAGADKLFDDAGQLINEDTGAFFASFMTAFARWIETWRRGASES